MSTKWSKWKVFIKVRSRAVSLSNPSKSKWFNIIKCYEHGNENENEKWWFCRESFSTYYQILRKEMIVLSGDSRLRRFSLFWCVSLMLSIRIKWHNKMQKRSISFEIQWFWESFGLFLSLQLSVQWYYKIIICISCQLHSLNKAFHLKTYC